MQQQPKQSDPGARPATRERGIEARTDGERGYDHGVFVPLLALMPEADVPVLAMSLVSSLDPKVH